MTNISSPVRLSISAMGGPRAPKPEFTSRSRAAYSAKPNLQSEDADYISVGSTQKYENNTHTKKRHRKELQEDQEEKEPTPPPTPPAAWSMFAEQVKVVSGSDLFLGEKKESYKAMCSDDHNKALEEVKALNLKRQAKTMMMRMTAVQRIKSANKYMSDDESVQSEYETEEESENEEEIAERERRKATARQHWGLIKRYVQDRIHRKRKKKGGFNQDKAFNRLRAQAKASLNPEQARRELFERYGIIPKPGRIYPEDIMKPAYSTRAHDIIAKFEQIQIISLHSVNRPQSYSNKRQKECNQRRLRPRTTNYGAASAKRFR